MASSRSASERRPSRRPRLCRAASATPKAAATPMAGAPRTTRVRMASATSCQRRAGALDLLGGQPRLVEQHEPAAVPADRRDHARPRGRAARGRSSRVSAPTRKSLSRTRRPATSSTADGGTPKRPRAARSPPGSPRRPRGAAVTRTRSAPSAPAHDRVRRAPRAATRTCQERRPQAWPAALIARSIRLEVLIEQALVHLEGGASPSASCRRVRLSAADLRLDGAPPRCARPRWSSRPAARLRARCSAASRRASPSSPRRAAGW